MTGRTYPLPRPESGNDPRFTFGLVFDVAKVLEDHGFPPVTSGSDHVELMGALFGFVYAAEKPPAPAVSAPRAGGGSPLTLAEYRSALEHWERKACQARNAGFRGEFDRRMEGVATLRKTIRRLSGRVAVAQRAELHLDVPDEALAALASHAGSGVAR